MQKIIKPKTFYRVGNEVTKQGLWYSSKGEFTGLIHKEFDFCQNRDLKMEFDESIVGWVSAVETVEDLWKWFSKDDVRKLQKQGWYILKYEAENYRFYDRFQHIIIEQKSSKFLEKIKIL